MVRTVQFVEASDIDWEHNKIHAFLMGQVLIGALSRPKPNQDADEWLKEQIVLFLNRLSEAGFIIEPVASVPSVFKAGGG